MQIYTCSYSQKLWFNTSISVVCTMTSPDSTGLLHLKPGATSACFTSNLVQHRLASPQTWRNIGLLHFRPGSTSACSTSNLAQYRLAPPQTWLNIGLLHLKPGPTSACFTLNLAQYRLLHLKPGSIMPQVSSSLRAMRAARGAYWQRGDNPDCVFVDSFPDVVAETAFLDKARQARHLFCAGTPHFKIEGVHTCVCMACTLIFCFDASHTYLSPTASRLPSMVLFGAGGDGAGGLVTRSAGLLGGEESGTSSVILSE